MPFKLTVIISIVIFAGAGRVALAQAVHKATLTGTVTDANGEHLPFTSVRIYSGAPEHLLTGTNSDSTGYFSLKIRPGTYLLKITFLSFKPYTKKIKLSSGETRSMGTIRLQPTAQSLRQTTVKAERSQMQLSFEKRVFEVGKDITSFGGSVLDVLNNVPSLITDFKGNISLRGSSAVKVLINSKPSNIYKNGSKALQSLPANLIKEVQVITNPSAKYGAEGSGGIINIIMKKNKDRGLHGSAGATQRHPEATQLSTNLNYKSGRVNWFLGGSIAYNEDPAHSRTFQRFNSADTSYIYRAFNNGNETDYHGTLRLGADLHLTKKQTLTASTSWFFEDKKDLFNGAYIDSTLTGRFLDRINRHERIGGGEAGNEASLEYENKLGGDDHKLSGSANYEYGQEKELPHIFESNPQSAADTTLHQIRDVRNSHELRFQTDFTGPVADSSKIEAGLRSTFSWQDNNYSTKKRQGGRLVPLPAFNDNYTDYENLNAAYATFSSNFGSFSYQLGLRGEQYHIQTKLNEADRLTENTYSNLFPSGFLTYHFNDDQSLQFSYSRRISRPYARLLLPTLNYSDTRSRFTGNPDLNPEFGNSYESQFLQYWETGSLLTSIYYRHRKGVIERITTLNAQGIFLTTPINLSTADAWGIELTADKEFTGGLKLSGSANLFRSKSNGTYQSEVYKRTTTRLTGRLGAEWEIVSGLKYQGYIRYYGPAQTIQGRRSPTTFVNMALAQDLFDGKATVSINSEDLFNTRRQEFTIMDPNYFSRQRFRETSGIRLHFTYRINQQKQEDEEE